jgi:spore maturation protein CgeB
MIVLVGGSGGTNIGSAYCLASESLGVDYSFRDHAIAYQGFWLVRKLLWKFYSKYPANLAAFSKQVEQLCTEKKARCLITTGVSPISAQALKRIGHSGIQRINYLTDDPWNPAHYASWFFKALPNYDVVFSPRKDNIEDLHNLGCANVAYLPFGFDSALFYPELIDDIQDISAYYQADIMFAGGADEDRLIYVKALSYAGLNVGLYGSYWERYPETVNLTRGQADLPTLRKAIAGAKVALCLVRRANRDGHCMRTFEVPAVGTCMLTEDTPEHRDIFGAEGKAVVYFSSLEEMVQKAQWLLDHDAERQRLAKSAHRLVTEGKHTYCDRLETMLSYV